MSATHCPYDGDFCQKKQLHFEAWQKAVLQSGGLVFQLNPEMFSGCSIEQSSERENICDRYRRYLFIINKQNVK